MYSLLLLAHVTGLVLFAGTTVVAFFISTAFWKSVSNDLQRAKHIHALSVKLPRIIGIGAALLILSGVAMVASTQGVIAQAGWFRVKFALVVLAIINALLFGRILASKLNKVIDRNESSPILALKSQYRLFYSMQILLIAAIATLGVLKSF